MLTRDNQFHLAVARLQRQAIGLKSTGDLRLARRFNGRAGRKEFCIAEHFGENLSIPLMFFGIDRPVPNVVQEAIEQCRIELALSDEEAKDILDILQEIDDERKQVA